MSIRWFPHSEFQAEGMRARAAGIGLDANPYPNSGAPRAEDCAVAWMQGWDRRDRAIAEGVPFDD